MAETLITNGGTHGTLKVGDIQFRGGNKDAQYQILTSSSNGVLLVAGDRDSDTYDVYPYMQVLAEVKTSPTSTQAGTYRVGVRMNADVMVINGNTVMTGDDINQSIGSAIYYVEHGCRSVHMDDTYTLADGTVLNLNNEFEKDHVNDL